MTKLCSSCQYTRFLQLMERLLALPHSSNQDQFVSQFRCQLEAQSKNQMVPPLQQDHRGVAFSTAHGTHARQRWSVIHTGAFRLCPSGGSLLLIV